MPGTGLGVVGATVPAPPIGRVWPTWHQGGNWFGVANIAHNGMVPIVRTWLAPVGFDPDHGQEMSMWKDMLA